MERGWAARWQRRDVGRSAYGASVPATLLREPYRCHPAIIGFCNAPFYQREIDVIEREVLDQGAGQGRCG